MRKPNGFQWIPLAPWGSPLQWDPMDADGLLQATPDGILFSEWIAQRGISKSTAYSWRNLLGIEPERRRQGTRVEVWLSAGQQALMERFADELARGSTVAVALERMGIAPESDGGQMVPTESNALQWTPDVQWSPPESSGTDLDRLHKRLAALRDAVDLGAPLTNEEVALLLGARPGRSEVVRGRLRAVRHKRNIWTIEPD